MDVKTQGFALGSTLAQVMQGFAQPPSGGGERSSAGTSARFSAPNPGLPSESRIAAAEQAGDSGEVRPRGSYVNFTV